MIAPLRSRLLAEAAAPAPPPMAEPIIAPVCPPIWLPIAAPTTPPNADVSAVLVVLPAYVVVIVNAEAAITVLIKIDLIFIFKLLRACLFCLDFTLAKQVGRIMKRNFIETVALVSAV